VKRGLLVVFTVTMLSLVTQAQSPERRGWGYGFVGVGGTTGFDRGTVVHAGVGGEGLILHGFGMGAEIGYLKASRGFGDGLAVLSVNPSYHFTNVTTSGKLVPFITGGGSLAFRGSSPAGGANFGGGIQYWGNERFGLKLEFRDHIFSSDSPHLYQFRVGIVFK
jgi:hypothetical protein